jgi:cytoskeletal protein RodZ
MDKKSKSQKKQSKNMKNLGFIAIIILIGLTVAAYLATPSNLQEIPISEARTKTNNNEVSAIVQKGNDLSITLKDQSEATLTSVKEEGTLQEQGFENGDWTLTVEPQSDGGGIWTTLAVDPIANSDNYWLLLLYDAPGTGAG